MGTYESNKKYRENNREVLREKSMNYYYNNREEINSKRRKGELSSEEKPKFDKEEYQKKWREENREYLLEKKRLYYINNKESINRKRNERRIKDPIFKLKNNISSSIRRSLSRSGYTKKSRTYEILGCSYEDFKLYLESKFEPWMNWNNHGLYNGELNYGWDIDHITPLNSAKTEEDIIKLNHYTNLQPLCSKVNRDIKKDNFEYGN